MERAAPAPFKASEARSRRGWGIPALSHEECLMGMMTRGGTLFPSPLGLSASWNPQLVEEVGQRIGLECRELGCHQGLAPVLDVSRDVRWGRTEETFGEDPYLVGVLATCYVRGLQDYMGVSLLYQHHGVAADATEAAALAFNAGLDIELPGDDCAQHLSQTVERGLITMATVDRIVSRVLTEKFRLGLFERTFADGHAPALRTPAVVTTALEAARQSIVVLDNRGGVLPLASTPARRIAVIGPTAADPMAQLSGYSYPSHVILHNQSEDTSHIVTPLQGLQEVYGAGNVAYAGGCQIIEVRRKGAPVLPGDVLNDPVLPASVVRPVREFKAFQRIELSAGEAARITFRVPLDMLGFTGMAGQRIVEPGRFDLEIGASSADIRLRTESRRYTHAAARLAHGKPQRSSTCLKELLMSTVFSSIDPIRYEGPESRNPLAFRWYDAQRVVLGKPLAEHLRPAACYWHSFCWRGEDIFGLGHTVLQRPWFAEADPVKAANLKLDAAFDFFERLTIPYWCFHDRDVGPEGATLAESNRILDGLLERAAKKMQATGVKLLWGTANLFSHPRFMSGAATNPDPEVYAYAAAQVKHVLEWTQRLNGENYVLWGGREGYETLLNTDLKRELDQYGRFLAAVVEHKHKIGFKGTLLIEPKPQEPTKHQYDYDSATVYGFLKRYGLENEVKVNLEVNHATLAGHSFEHEVATAAALGILGSIDANRGDEQLGWDTDQFPNNHAALVPAMLEIIRYGGIGSGGMNFDSKLRRQSTDVQDLYEGHVGGLDTIARAFLAAAALFESGELERALSERYSGWNGDLGQRIQAGVSLDELAGLVHAQGVSPAPRSGRQERLENIVNRFV